MLEKHANHRRLRNQRPDARLHVEICLAFGKPVCKAGTVVAPDPHDPRFRRVPAVSCAVNRKVAAFAVPCDVNRSVGIFRRHVQIERSRLLGRDYIHKTEVEILLPTDNRVIRSAVCHHCFSGWQAEGYRTELHFFFQVDQVRVCLHADVAEAAAIPQSAEESDDILRNNQTDGHLAHIGVTRQKRVRRRLQRDGIGRMLRRYNSIKIHIGNQ